MDIFTNLLVVPLANGLILFYRTLGGNLGLAIIAFTLFLKVGLNPLNKPYMDSMKKIRDLAPSLQKLKERHKDDRIKLAQAQAEFYKQNKVNPGAGCLPYLLQIIILIALFNVFSRTLSPGFDVTQKFNELLYQNLKFEEGEQISTRFLYLNLTDPDKLNISQLNFPLPGPLLILAAALQFVSAKVSMPGVRASQKAAQKTDDKSDDFQVSMQKSMIYMFPLMTLVIGLQFSSALALYWLIFSVTQTYSQVRSSGWGELSAFINRFKLVNSTNTNKKS